MAAIPWEFFMPLRGTQNWGKMSQSALFQSSAGIPPATNQEPAGCRRSQGGYPTTSIHPPQAISPRGEQIYRFSLTNLLDSSSAWG